MRCTSNVATLLLVLIALIVAPAVTAETIQRDHQQEQVLTFDHAPPDFVVELPTFEQAHELSQVGTNFSFIKSEFNLTSYRLSSYAGKYGGQFRSCNATTTNTFNRKADTGFGSVQLTT